MTTSLWGPVPYALIEGLSTGKLSWAERGVLLYLYLYATKSDDGATVPVERRAGEAVTAAWKRALGEEASTIIGGFVESGLLATVPEGLRITILPRGFQGGQRAPEAPREHNAPTPSMKPSDTAAGRRLRNDRADFAKRLGRWRDVSPDCSWSAWLTTPDGVAHLVAREASHPGYGGVVAEGVARGSAPPGSAGGSALPSAPVAPPGSAPPLRLSDRSSLSGEDRERESGTRDPDKGVAPPGSALPSAGGSAPPAARGVAPLSESPIFALREAAIGNADLVGNLPMEMELSALLRRFNLTPDEVTAMGDALGTTALWWPNDEPPLYPSLRDLAGYFTDGVREWGPVLALVGYVRAEMKRRALHPPWVPPPPLYIVTMTPEQKARQPKTLAEAEARIAAEDAAIEAAKKAGSNGR